MDRALSENTQRVMRSARTQALQFHHEYQGTEHILLAIAGEPAGLAPDVLRSLGITLERVRSGVEHMVGIGPVSASPEDRGVTPRAKRVIDFAHEEADLLRSPQVEPEHLLLGITREVQGAAAQVLRDLQVPPENVREKLRVLLSRGGMEE